MKLTKIELRLTIDELTESITNWDRMSLLHDGEPDVLKEVKLKLERELNRQQSQSWALMSKP